jgi:hypothetical protein
LLEKRRVPCRRLCEEKAARVPETGDSAEKKVSNNYESQNSIQRIMES